MNLHVYLLVILLYFYALTAHFGHWLQVGRRERNVRRRQVESNLIYGQVKKS